MEKETVWMALKEENLVLQQDVASFFFRCFCGRSGGYPNSLLSKARLKGSAISIFPKSLWRGFRT
jgi:hypothetical protein